jgi:3-methyladenine DNA glycosylase Tag
MVNDPVFDAFQPKAIVATTEDEVKQILRDATVSINEYMNDNIKVV